MNVHSNLGRSSDVAAKLQVVSGPLRKSEFPLRDTVSIGCDAACTIRLGDSAVSPRHCEIQFAGGRLLLRDLDSHSGTFVNGIPVTQRELKFGDELAVGDSVFVVVEGKPLGPDNRMIEFTDGELRGARVLEIHSGDLFTLDHARLSAMARSERIARNFDALVYLCKGIGCLRDEESLPWQLLSMVFDSIPASRGALLLLEEDSLDVRAQVGWDRAHGPGLPVPVSRCIVDRVLHERVSLLHDGAAGQADSLPSFLCVPLLSGEKPIGLIYLESLDAAAPLTEDDFRLLAAIAGLGSIALENVRRLENLGSENRRLRAQVTLTHDMVGASPRMREVYQFIERVAPTDSTVLIYGESGTGKELVANAIHFNSARKAQPFVALNCAALSETLLESELFGHEKGAFTSAVNQKKGYLEVAEGGTVFLDEIGELSLLLQAKLLRVLQEREFVRVGGTRPIKINVRFLAATNRDLQKSAREEKFRPDLYHRLNVISIALPPLREHPEDIPALAEHFTARHARNCARRITGISPEALAALCQYDWPGNIRELENAMERAVVIGVMDQIVADDLPDSLVESAKGAPAAPARYHHAIRDLKKHLILGALDRSAGSITEAARLLGVHANYLHRLMRNLDLRATLKKRAADQ